MFKQVKAQLDFVKSDESDEDILLFLQTYSRKVEHENRPFPAANWLSILRRASSLKSFKEALDKEMILYKAHDTHGDDDSEDDESGDDEPLPVFRTAGRGLGGLGKGKGLFLRAKSPSANHSPKRYREEPSQTSSGDTYGAASVASNRSGAYFPPAPSFPADSYALSSAPSRLGAPSDAMAGMRL
jgi:hypothetical protein